MGRKVFVSVLGTGFYDSCRYMKDNFVSSNTRFVQCATLELIKAKEEWQEGDAVIVLLTDGARIANWDVTIRRNRNTGKDEAYEGLLKLLMNMKLPCKLYSPAIPDGRNEEEMWRIFEILFKELQDGDELYFDLTHSFRYLPMLVLVLGNYAKFLKDVSVKHISYGNYEARNTETNEAPIIDLCPLSSLQDWTFAAANYLQNGDASRLNALCRSSLTPILRDAEKREKSPSANILKKYVQALQVVTEDMKGCRGINIVSGKNIETTMRLSQQLSKVIISPMQPILEKMKDSFAKFTPSEDILNGYRAAKWCYEHQLYQQSLTILHENIVSQICEAKHWDYKDRNQRELVNKAFAIFLSEIDEHDWKVETEMERQLIKDLLNMNLVKDLQSTFLITTALRNDYNHAGMRDNPVGVQKFANGLKERINIIYAMFLQDEAAIN